MNKYELVAMREINPNPAWTNEEMDEFAEAYDRYIMEQEGSRYIEDAMYQRYMDEGM